MDMGNVKREVAFQRSTPKKYIAILIFCFFSFWFLEDSTKIFFHFRKVFSWFFLSFFRSFIFLPSFPFCFFSFLSLNSHYTFVVPFFLLFLFTTPFSFLFQGDISFPINLASFYISIYILSFFLRSILLFIYWKASLCLSPNPGKSLIESTLISLPAFFFFSLSFQLDFLNSNYYTNLCFSSCLFIQLTMTASFIITMRDENKDVIFFWQHVDGSWISCN